MTELDMATIELRAARAELNEAQAAMDRAQARYTVAREVAYRLWQAESSTPTVKAGNST